MPTVLELLPALVAKIKKSKGKTKQRINMGRKFFRDHNIEPNPVGDKNSKTGLLGTYGKVGETCPSYCPWLDNGCFAQQSRVNLQQQRASIKRESSLAAYAIALTVSLLIGQIVRIHVSGDYCRNDQVDIEYVNGACEVTNKLKEIFGTPEDMVAFAYTHIHKAEFEPYRIQLQESGIYTMYSEEMEPGGAVVIAFDKIPEVREKTGLTIKACINQTTDGRIKCKDCSWCWTAREREIVVAFKPHSIKAKQILKISNDLIELMLNS